MSVAIFEDGRCEAHIPDTKILPETSHRIKTISKSLRSAPFKNKLIFMEGSIMSADELKKYHKSNYLDYLSQSVSHSKKTGEVVYLNNDPDVVVSEGSELAAQAAAGTVRDATTFVIKNSEDDKNNIKKAFCNVRPPGHHSQCNKGAGFCLYNNVWIGAQTARELLGENSRIAIVDIDLHHGDGTESFVSDNPFLHTYFTSIHQKYNSIYPGTGKECFKRQKNSIINNHNIRLGEGDLEVKTYFTTFLLQSLKDWKPDIIFISCGFDAHELDQIGNLNYSTDLYGWISAKLSEIADECCKGRLVSVLEGGYNLKALRDASRSHVQGLITPSLD